MNAPPFDITRINSAYGSAAWVKEMVQETSRCCDNIDARISRIQQESLALTSKSIALETQYNTSRGLFARIRLMWAMNSLSREIEWRRKVLLELWTERQRRTMSW